MSGIIMISFEDARNLVLAKLEIANVAGKSTGIKVVLLEEFTETIPSGWVFFYNSEEFLRTQNFSDQLFGNCPYFITKEGEVIRLPTHSNWDTSLKEMGYL